MNSWKRLHTTAATDHGDVRGFFDRSAPTYTEQHGPARRLLEYRLRLLRRLADLNGDEIVLEIGCGDGQHIVALADEMARGIGVDISQKMVDAARRMATEKGVLHRLDFAADLGEELATVDDGSIDVAFCVGSLEHMLDHAAVAESVRRVLRPGGRFVGLTPNGGYLWYRRLAPLFGLATRHLSTDRFLEQREIGRFLHRAGFTDVGFDHWTFIPRGDMHEVLAGALALLDRAGSLAGIGAWRGGLQFTACWPGPSESGPDSTPK